MTHYTIKLPYPTPPLNSNQRLHQRPRALRVRDLRDTTQALVSEARVPRLGRAHMELVWLVNSRHHRDADNIVPTLKAVADGVGRAGVVVDDTPDLLDKAMPIIAYVPRALQPQSLWLVLWQLEDDQPSPLERLQHVYMADERPSAQEFAGAISAAFNASLGDAK